MPALLNAHSAVARRCLSATLLSSIGLIALIVTMYADDAAAQSYVENFDVVPVPGWTTQNNSTTIGTTGWFQGSSTTFPAHSGAPNSYIAANRNSTTGTNTISNWLISPERPLTNGDVITFWTRQPDTFTRADRLQVRLSVAGSSTDVGTGPTGVGDFTTLLLDVNPTYNLAGYPSLGWGQFFITISGLPAPASGRIAFRYFVENGGPTGTRSNYIGIDSFVHTPASKIVPSQNVVDFNGDGKTDYALVRNIGGGPSGQVRWFIQLSGLSTSYSADWGLVSDQFVPQDYDGDNKSDLAVWRGGAPNEAAFYIVNSQTNTIRIERFGQTGDDPSVVEDYDGDGKADLAVYRPGQTSGAQSFWYYRGSLNNPGGNVTYVPWGKAGDFQAPGDYDGDGKGDFIVQRNELTGWARIWMLLSTQGFKTLSFGNPTDQIVPGDYDGDGTTDLAVVRSSAGQWQWWISHSSKGAILTPEYFGVSATDFPAQGDYDGDGKTDLGVYRPSTTPGASGFWVKQSTAGPRFVPYGTSGDYPVANYNVH